MFKTIFAFLFGRFFQKSKDVANTPTAPSVRPQPNKRLL